MDNKKIVEITTLDGVTIVSFNEISMGAAAEIETLSRQMTHLIEGDKPMKMVVDFEKVKFFSSQTLGLLLDVRKKLQAYNGQVVISGINPQLHRVFKITNLDKIFTFYPDVESTVNGIS